MAGTLGAFLAIGIVPHAALATPRGLRRPFAAGGAATESALPGDSVVHSPCAVPNNPLTYHGGALVHDPDVFLIFWGPQWNTSPAHIAARNRLVQMFQAIGTSDFACAWREYGVNGEPLGAGTYNGSYVIPTTPPNPLDDSVIQSRILTEVAAGHAPPRTDDRVYIVIPPSGVPVSAGGETGCGGANFTFCGYHDAFVAGGAFRYAVLPYPCSQGSGTCFVDATEDVGRAFQVVGSHELTELVTDPDSSPGGWYSDRTGDENADLCAGSDCVDSVTNGAVTFAVNPAWSNFAKGCITSIPCPPQPIVCTDPAPGVCVPGAPRSESCAVELLVDPNLTLKRSTGLPTSKVTCGDGQNLCDFDNTAGQCTFHVATCFNNQDPRLPGCAGASVNSISVKLPLAGDPIATALLGALQGLPGASASGATVSFAPAIAGNDVCTAYANVVVPAGQRRSIRLSAAFSTGPVKASLKLTCTP